MLRDLRERSDAGGSDTIDERGGAHRLFVFLAVRRFAVLAERFDETEVAEPRHRLEIIGHELLSGEPAVILIGEPHLAEQRDLGRRERRRVTHTPQIGGSLPRSSSASRFASL